LGGRKGIRPVKTEWWGAGAAICLEQGADLHTAQPTPLPLTASCLSKIQIGLYILTAFLHLFRAFVSLADAIYEHNLKQAFRLVLKLLHLQYTHTHTHTHLFNGPLSGTTRVSWYQKGKTNLDFTEARDSEWQRHQLGHMQVRTRLQTDNHASTPPLVFHRPDALPAAQSTASKH